MPPNVTGSASAYNKQYGEVPRHRCAWCRRTGRKQARYYELTVTDHPPDAPPQVMITCDRPGCQAYLQDPDVQDWKPRNTDYAAWLRWARWVRARARREHQGPRHLCARCGKRPRNSQYFAVRRPDDPLGMPPRVFVLCDDPECLALMDNTDVRDWKPTPTDGRAWGRWARWVATNPLQRVNQPAWRRIGELAVQVRRGEESPRAALANVRQALQGDCSLPARALNKLAGALRKTLKEANHVHQ